MTFQTDVSGPSSPRILNLTCQNNEALYLHWERPSVYYNSVDYYFLYYRSEDKRDDEFEEISIYSPNGGYEHDVCN